MNYLEFDFNYYLFFFLLLYKFDYINRYIFMIILLYKLHKPTYIELLRIYY